MTSVPPPPRYCARAAARRQDPPPTPPAVPLPRSNAGTGTVDDGSAAGFAAVAAAHLGLAAALLAQPVAAADFILGPKLLAGWQPEQVRGAC
jgi:hypothetical protein